MCPQEHRETFGGGGKSGIPRKIRIDITNSSLDMDRPSLGWGLPSAMLQCEESQKSSLITKTTYRLQLTDFNLISADDVSLKLTLFQS